MTAPDAGGTQAGLPALLDQELLRRRLRSHPWPAPLADDPARRRAAVLVPILSGPEPAILLTKRTPHLSSHAGQVAFPGGRIDPTDRSAEAAALREAEEEIGLDPALVSLLGRLPDQDTGTGFRITPIVGLLPPDPPLSPAPAEVEALLHLPFSVLLDPAAPQRRQSMLRGRLREYWVWPHPEHDIWGATATILVRLALVLRGPDE